MAPALSKLLEAGSILGDFQEKMPTTHMLNSMGQMLKTLMHIQKVSLMLQAENKPTLLHVVSGLYNLCNLSKANGFEVSSSMTQSFINLFENNSRCRIPSNGRQAPQYAIANFLHPHFKGDGLNLENNTTYFAQTKEWIIAKFRPTSEEDGVVEDEQVEEDSMETTSQSVLTETKLQEYEWEYCNYDRPEVTAALKLTTRRKKCLSSIEHEVEFYLNQSDDPKTILYTDCDVLEYWKGHQHVMPMLARLASEIFAIPATSAPSERVFSGTGLIVKLSSTRKSRKN